jgi:hypothetical protein
MDGERVVKYDVGGLGAIVTIANVLVTIVLVVAMYVDSHSATVAVLSGIGFFVVSTTLTLLTLSGTLTAIVVGRQKEVTTRRMHMMQLEVYRTQAGLLAAPEPLMLPAPVEEPALAPLEGSMPAVEPLPPPSMPARFVPAVDASAARDAILWAMTLYTPEGQPDPSKVRLDSKRESAGRLRVPAPKSSAVKEFLLTKRVLERVDGGLRLRVDRFGSSAKVRELMSMYVA